MGNRKFKIAILFPRFMGGGAEAVCAWMMEALSTEYDVTLVTLANVSLDYLDEQYGTSLVRSTVKVHVVPLRLPHWLNKWVLTSFSAFSIRQFALMRAFKRTLQRKFDLAISAFNEMDLGAPGIQYIHLPMFGKGHERIRPVVGHPHSPARWLYRELLRTCSGYSERRMRGNKTIANSEWTAAWIQRLYGIDAEVVYPPVVGHFPIAQWDKRENGFVMVTRIVPEKRIELALSILEEVRKQGYDVHLHILGGVGDIRYWSELKRKTACCDWVFWEERLTRQDYWRLLNSHRYGIHPRKNEQFGLGVAEMVHAGVIPFVPLEGGQAEIVNHNPYLVWSDRSEAVAKIVQVLSSERLQSELRLDLNRSFQRFSAERFREEIRRIVAEFLECAKEESRDEDSHLRLRLRAGEGFGARRWLELGQADRPHCGRGMGHHSGQQPLDD